MNPLRISARLLAELSSPWFCPRCYWAKLRLKGKLPFQFFPGVFSCFDSMQKRLTWLHWERHGKPPFWLESFGEISDLIEPPHWSKFRALDKDTGIELRGVPDLIVRRKDDSFGIVDYKTARLTEGQEALKPMYQIQLAAYAWIAERCGFRPVGKIGLVYFEPMTEVSAVKLSDQMSENGFNLGFRAKSLSFLPKTGSIEPLLRQVREIGDWEEPPGGREECKDCNEIDNIQELLGHVPSAEHRGRAATCR